jgi:hypothetical protein
LVVALLELGDFPALDREIGMFERRAGLLHQPLLGWYAPLFRGMRALLRGDIEAAQRFHVEVAAVAARTGSANAGMLAATLGIGIDVALDRPSPIDEFEALTDVDPAVWASLASALGFVAMRSGDRARTQTLLRFHADDGFERVARDSEYLATLTMFGRIAVWLGDGRAMDDLYDRLASYTGMWVVDGIAAHCWGPVDLELARLAAALDRRDEAIAHLDAARAAVASAGARLLGVDIDDLALELSVAGHSRELAASAATGPNVFRDDGDVWTLTYQGHSVLMKASKGLGDIARLLAEPGHEVHVSDLYGDRAPNVVAHRSADLGDVLDAPARAAYRARLVELETELADAEAVSDRGRAEAAADERDFLAAELAAALGLGGKPRKAGDPNERARKAVSTRIRLAIERLAEPHPLLARHLGNSIRTGAFCSYQPEHPTTWTL